MTPSKRDVERRVDDLEDTDEDDDAGVVYIYDTADADEPAVVIGGDED